MRIGIPPVDALLVAAGLVAVLLTIDLVHQPRDEGAPAGSTPDVAAAPGAGPPVLVVVAASSPADVAVGDRVADAAGGLLLAVDANGLTEVRTADLSRSRPDQVLVLGGPAAVSEATASALEQYTSGSVTRLAGADRFATAAMAAQSWFPRPVRHVWIVSGDATAVRPPTTDREGAHAPVLLVARDRIPSSTAAALRELRPRSIGVLGGRDAVSDGVLEQLRVFTPGRVVRPG